MLVANLLSNAVTTLFLQNLLNVVLADSHVFLVLAFRMHLCKAVFAKLDLTFMAVLQASRFITPRALQRLAGVVFMKSLVQLWFRFTPFLANGFSTGTRRELFAFIPAVIADEELAALGEEVCSIASRTHLAELHRIQIIIGYNAQEALCTHQLRS